MLWVRIVLYVMKFSLRKHLTEGIKSYLHINLFLLTGKSCSYVSANVPKGRGNRRRDYGK